jgi:integrase/recombinase XerD
MPWQITRDKFLSKEERDRLLKSTEEKALIDLAKGRSTWVRRWMVVDLALFSGLRVSEITALRVGDLRLNSSEKLIYVQKGKGSKSGYVTIDRALAKHLKEFIAWKKTTGELVDAEAPLLTGSSDGRPYTTRSLQMQFKEVLKNAGLPTRYSIHSCRHTFAAYLLAESKNLRLVQKQLRHSSPGVTAVYADVTPEDVSAAMESLKANGDNNSPGKKGKKPGKKNHVCSLCKNEITRAARQLHIDGSEIEICPVCCERIKG